MKRKLLIIDGAYFGQRVLGQVNMGDSVNNLETEAEKRNFSSSLRNSLINLYQTFNNSQTTLIDNIIFVTDSGSWRKDVTPYRPYYIPEDSNVLIGYKEQRKSKKEESPINYDNYYALYNEFVESIREQVIVFNIAKLEGDDNIMLISDKLRTMPNTLGIIFGNDGDLDQVIRDNCIILRNIRSKDAPNGEFVITLKLFGELFEKTLEQSMLGGGSLDEQYFKQLLSVQIGAIDGNNRVRRELNRGISIATPFRTALVKSIAGDKKDNIFSLISWSASTGTRNYSITEKYIEKAMSKHGYSLTESNCQKLLFSKENVSNLLLALREVTKQQTEKTNLETLTAHLKHNLKINMLTKNNVPAEYLEKFEECWNENLERINNETLDFKNLAKLASLNTNMRSNGIDVLSSSIPGID